MSTQHQTHNVKHGAEKSANPNEAFLFAIKCLVRLYLRIETDV